MSRPKLSLAIRHHQQAIAHAEQGQLQAAEADARRALHMFAKVAGRAAPATAHTTFDLGNILRLQDRWPEARAAYAETGRLLVRRLRSPQAHPALVRLTVEALARRAEAERQLGFLARAERTLDQAEKVATRHLGRACVERFALLNDRGVLRKAQGRYTEAERLYRRVLARLKQSPRPDRQALAGLYHNLGGICHARGQLGRAEEFARAGLACRRASDRAEKAADMGALAAILDARAKPAEAMRLYKKALQIFASAGAPAGYEQAVIWENVGVLHHRAQAPLLARRHLEQAIGLYAGACGKDHPETKLCEANLAVVLVELGERRRARTLLARALRLLEPALGPRHPRVVLCRTNYQRLQSGVARPAKRPRGSTPD